MAAGRLVTYIYYGLGLCTAGGTGTFLWHHSRKLDQEPPSITPVTTPEISARPADNRVIEAPKGGSGVPEPASDPFATSKKTSPLATVNPGTANKTVVTAIGDAPAASPLANQASKVRGGIAIKGPAGTTTGYAPATDLDRTATVTPEQTRPASGGPTFFAGEDARAKESRRQQTKRQAAAKRSPAAADASK